MVKNARGFTLIEALMVVVIIGILAASMPGLLIKTYQNIKLTSITNTMKRQIMVAKTRAIANPKTHCGVYFDTTEGNQKVIIFLDNTLPNSYQYDAGSDQTYSQTIEMPPSIKFSLPSGNAVVNGCIIFRGDGSAKTGGAIKIETIQSGRYKTIDILPSTGRVRITSS